MMSRWQRLLNKRHHITAKIIFAVMGAVVLTVIASVVGVVFLQRIGDNQRTINNEVVPLMATAFAVAERSQSLAAALPRLNATRDNDELNAVSDEIAGEATMFESYINQLMASNLADETITLDQAVEIAELGETLRDNITKMKELVRAKFETGRRSKQLLSQLQDIEDETTNLLVHLIDSQLFYTVTGYKAIDDPPDARDLHFNEKELGRYRSLSELYRYSTLGTQLLASTFTEPDVARLEPLKESFESTMNGIDRHLSLLDQDEMHGELSSVFTRLREVGLGNEGIFNLRKRELNALVSETLLISDNRVLAGVLVHSIEGFVVNVEKVTSVATVESAETIDTAKNILFALTCITIAGAIIISYFYIAKRLLKRIETLSDRMKDMAQGNLEVDIDVGGQDEVTEMAEAMEVFRRHALEVLRLNQVEKLANELKAKNDQLEETNVELRRAQDQIVMREKLVALGELTAGVAHEIKNPMNFIMNFSEVSVELLEEMIEEFKNPEDPESGVDMELVDEIANDLTSNLQRIREHGGRANRIVVDMLRMGRDTAEFMPCDVNLLVDQQARLAFHSARAVDSGFQLEIINDFDESIGEMEVVQQDLGRVFVNMVTNAGYACDEKRKRLKAADASSDYQPQLMCSTRKENGRVLFRFKDNGSGIPEDVIERIFNPFFTTKPTDKGTGLGLALSNDIVRTHGGTIEAQSAPGEWTEITINLPENPAKFVAPKESAQS